MGSPPVQQRGPNEPSLENFLDGTFHEKLNVLFSIKSKRWKVSIIWLYTNDDYYCTK